MKIAFLIIQLALASSTFAATGVSFLEIPVGARESALGGSGAALITGPTSTTYNPATAAMMPRSVALMHTRHLGDTRAQFVGVNLRHKRLAIAPHYWGTRVADIEYRTSPTRQPISTFDAINSSFGAALAFEINSHWSAGVAGRYIYEKIHVESSDGFGFDAGVIARDYLKGLTLGAAMQHAGHMNEFAAESPQLPTTLRGGAAYEHTLSKWGTLLGVVEAQAVRENTPLFKGGIEYRAPDYLAVRVGYISGLDAQDVSLGLGFFFKHYRLDYAFIPFRENLGEGHRFSLTLDI